MATSMPKPVPGAAPGPAAPDELEAPEDPASLLNHLLETAPILVAVVDQHLRYLSVSQAYAHSMGRPMHKIIGAHVREVLPPEAYAVAHSHLQAALAGEPQVYELLLPAAQGQGERIVRVHYVPRLDDAGTQAGFTMFGVEITSLKKSQEERVLADAAARRFELQNEELKQVQHKLLAAQSEAAAHAASALEAQSRLRSEAERRNEEKSRFLADAVHDLRQPLQTLANASSPLIRQLESGQYSDALASARMIRSASTLLNQQLNGMLEISQLELGQIRPCFAQFALRDLFKDLRLQFEKSCEALDVSLHVDADAATAQVRVDSDFHLLFRALSNLVSNSIKYRDYQRGAPCYVRLSHTLEQGEVRIVVEDNGIGIPAAALEGGRIFQPFYQANRDHPGSRSGVGLGLSIVKAVVRLLPGHRLDIHSSVGRGTAVHLTLPAMPQQQHSTPGAPALTHAEAEQMASIDGLRILLVDDNPLLLASLTMLLESANAQVWAAQDLREVQALLQDAAVRPDVLVTDHRLRGEGSGMQVITQVLQQVGQVPTLMLTGSPDYKLGASGMQHFRVIYKPITPEHLTANIAEMARRAVPGHKPRRDPHV